MNSLSVICPIFGFCFPTSTQVSNKGIEVSTLEERLFEEVGLHRRNPSHDIHGRAFLKYRYTKKIHRQESSCFRYRKIYTPHYVIIKVLLISALFKLLLSLPLMITGSEVSFGVPFFIKKFKNNFYCFPETF